MTSRPRRTRLRAGAGYLLLFAAAFYVALVVAFPIDAVRRALVAAVERDSALTLVVGELALGWHGDLHATGVALAWPGPDRPVPLFVADLVDLQIGPWALVRGRLAADFTGAAYDGSFAGRVEGPVGGSAERVTLRLTRLDLARHTGLRSLARVVIAGRLSGDLALRRPARDGATAGRGGPTGAIRLALVEGSLRELPVVGTSLPVVTIESGTASGALEANRLDVKALEIKGPEVSLSASGQIGFREPPAASTLNGTLRIKPEPRLPPAVRRLLAALARTPDATGAYGFLLLGTLGTPEIRPL
jgi:type II secretion system protein N